jgi:hypothetical protein
MIVELKFFENLNATELETEFSQFLRIKANLIEKIYFKQKVSCNTEPINDSQTGNYPLDSWHTGDLIMFQKNMKEKRNDNIRMFELWQQVSK